MRVSYRWLSSVLGTQYPLETIADRLTMNGIEVENILDLGAASGKIVVARILEIYPHPNADQLVLCRVDAGVADPLRIVCGAKNMKAGDLVPLALEGAKLPNGMVLKRSKIRGEVSEGMMCSARELGWSDDASGLLILPENWIYKVGEPFDALLELKITPNRPDCLSLYGVARDLAAALGLSNLVTPDWKLSEGDEPAERHARLSVEAPDACPRYTARVIRGVTVGPSPLWLQRAVESAGMRSINNVVDVTNYILIEQGHPLHAFDLDLVAERHVVVRYAREGERIRTLDEQEYELRATDLLIADSEKAIALAGIMGCGNTEISASTRNVFLECAYFHPPTIRRTSKRLAKTTESSYRFERGTDWSALDTIVDRAAALIQEVAGGTVCRDRFDEGPSLLPPKPIELRVDRLNLLSGLSLSVSEAAKPLSALGFAVEEHSDHLIATPPPARCDVSCEADLVEEITRIVGYDRVPTVLPRIISRARELSEEERLVSIVREICVEFGLAECVNYSFLSGAFLNRVGFNAAENVQILNPLSAEFDTLRPHLVPGLLQSVVFNQNHGTADVWLYEIGKVFYRDPSVETGFGERTQFSMVLSGIGSERTWRQVGRVADFFEGKSVACALLERLGVPEPVVSGEATSSFLHPGKAGWLTWEGNKLIEVGELHPRLQSALELKRNVVVVWGNLEVLAPLLENRTSYKEIPPFPPVSRDLALVADRSVPAGAIEEVVKRRAKSLLASMKLFDIYEGDRIPAGKRSLAYQLRFSAADRTLTDDEVNQLVEKIIADLQTKLGVELRR
ncbi:MAG: phenylalanine--tRNA ligase subunit beta [Candidatus Sumerlaeaceae bacterium]|nr:phenylalanine--tRNA ligase subunit beta [Candidatus Sumerlaeaceae bacterium]